MLFRSLVSEAMHYYLVRLLNLQFIGAEVDTHAWEDIKFRESGETCTNDAVGPIEGISCITCLHYGGARSFVAEIVVAIVVVLM